MEELDYIIYTDGSANSSDRGASACIVQNATTLESYNLVCLFGQSTNNQAEIFATLLGYAFLNLLEPNKQLTVKLVSDSEYVLKSSTIYIDKWIREKRLEGMIPSLLVKNAAIWRTFLELTKNFTLVSEHVKGHSGNLENEKCDYAAGFIRKAKNLALTTGQPVEIIKTNRKKIVYKDLWLYADCSSILELLTSPAPNVEFALKCLYNQVQFVHNNNNKVSVLPLTRDKQLLQVVRSKLQEAISLLNTTKDLPESLEYIKQKIDALTGELTNELNN